METTPPNKHYPINKHRKYSSLHNSFPSAAASMPPDGKRPPNHVGITVMDQFIDSSNVRRIKRTT